MPDPGVNIKVAVSGVNESKQALESVGDKAAQTAAKHSGATAGAAVSQETLTKATERGAGAQLDFDRKAQSVVQKIAGSLSPELANAAGFALDLAEGFGRITPEMLKVGGAGAAIAAAIGIVASKFSDLAREARDAEAALKHFHEAQRNMRDESLDRASKLEGELNKVGLFGLGPEAAALSEQLTREQFIPADLADKTAVAAKARVGGIPLTAVDMESLAAGLLTSAPPEFTGKADEDWMVVEGLMNRGVEPQRMAALNAHRLAVMHRTLREARFDQSAPGAVDIDTAIERMKRAGVMSDSEEGVARGILEGGKDASFFRTWMQFIRREGAGDAGAIRPAGADQTISNIVGGVENARASIRGGMNTLRESWAGGSPTRVTPDSKPTTIIQNQTVVHTNAIYSGPRGPRTVADLGTLQAEWE